MAGAALIGLTAASAIYNGYAQNEAGQAQKKLANKNADLLDASAADAVDRGNQDAMQITRRAKRLKGEQRASFAGQGVDVNTGTAAALQDETLAMGELDAEQTRKNAFREAWGIKGQASNQRLSGRYAQRAGQNQAFGTLLGGAGNTAQAYYQYNPPKAAGGH